MNGISRLKLSVVRPSVKAGAAGRQVLAQGLAPRIGGIEVAQPVVDGQQVIVQLLMRITSRDTTPGDEPELPLQ
jgi:hypothetical protein